MSHAVLRCPYFDTSSVSFHTCSSCPLPPFSPVPSNLWRRRSISSWSRDFEGCSKKRVRHPLSPHTALHGKLFPAHLLSRDAVPGRYRIRRLLKPVSTYAPHTLALPDLSCKRSCRIVSVARGGILRSETERSLRDVHIQSLANQHSLPESLNHDKC